MQVEALTFIVQSVLTIHLLCDKTKTVVYTQLQVIGQTV